MRLRIGLFALMYIAIATAVQAQPPKKAPVKNQDVTRGQRQVQGGDGVFGTVYTLNSGMELRASQGALLGRALQLLQLRPG